MNAPETNIVKIESPEGLASGFIHNPTNDLDYVYIITVRHCVIKEADNMPVPKSSITIFFFNEKSSSYTLSEADTMLYGINNNIEDIAVIIINRKSIPQSIDISLTTSLAKLTGDEKKCIITGVPKAVNNELKRTLYEAEFLSDKDYPDQIQIKVSDPITDFYNSGHLVEGYSGSPIFIESAGHYYPCGIFQAYEDFTKRILAINLSPIKHLVLDAGFPEITFIEVETDSGILTNIQRLRANTTRVLNRIKDQIGEVRIVRQEELKKLKKNIQEHSFVLISGKAGIGKSAFAKHAISELSADYEIVALQGEQLDKTGITEIFSTTPFSLSGNFDGTLMSKGMKLKKIILIDSLEKLLESSNADTVIDFFSLLKQRTDITLILTCRSYAVGQLQIKFLQQFPGVQPFEIPALSEEELKVIQEKYPSIAPMLLNPSLKKLLRIPFNLDKAVTIQSDGFAGKINSESDFKQVMWEYVIENAQRETDPELRKKRSRVFSEIALIRARLMAPFVSIEGASHAILLGLTHDNVIEADPVLSERYAAAHDIYEDWALTRFIESKFQDFVSTETLPNFFYTSIGYAPAIRRAFRIWISEKLQNTEHPIETLIQNTIGDENLEQYWKDEVLIGVMQSTYSQTFLNKNKSLLFSNDASLFKRCLLLLQVACQTPNLFYLKGLKDKEKSNIYRNAYLKPFGDGWPNMINFIFEHIDDLESQFQFIVSFLLQWEKRLEPFLPLPAEARVAGLILLRYFDCYKDDTENYKSSDKKQVEKGIALTLKLSSALPSEVRSLIGEALAMEKSKERDWRKRSFSEKVIEYVLSWSHSMEVCQIDPDLVIKVAEKEWFYYEPSAEEQVEIIKSSPFKSFPREMEKEEKFGIVSEFKRSYFPAGPYETPIFYLLNRSPEKAIPFITKLFNHSLDAFKKSDFLKAESFGFMADERYDVEINMANGSTINQSGSLALWTMYRGTFVATPYLLQSVLMTLENWLLQSAKIVIKDKDGKHARIKDQLDFAYDYLMKESKSVATTAVLISVATAQPELFGNRVLPLLAVRQFYEWDFLRCRYESKALAPAGDFSPDARWKQKDRHESNQLEHRKQHMENLTLKLSFGEHREAVLGILDKFYEQSPEDINWKFALNRMDRRKLEIIGKVENGFIVQAKIDDDLKVTAEESRVYAEKINSLSEASNWGRKKLKREHLENDSYEEWQKNYKKVVFEGAAEGKVKLFNNPAMIAAVGVRDFFDELSEVEMKWCFDWISNVANYELRRNQNPYDMGLDSPFGAFEIEPAFIGLIDLAHKCGGDYKAKARELLFASIIFVRDELEREEITKNFKETLWEAAPDFALACIKGMIAYSSIAELRMRIGNYRPSQAANQPIDAARKPISGLLAKIMTLVKNIFANKNDETTTVLKTESDRNWETHVKEYNEKLFTIVEEVVGGKILIDFENLETIHQSPYYLIETLLLIPENTNNKDLQLFCSKIMDFILANLEPEDRFSNEKIPYKLQQDFQSYFASFLLRQSPETALLKFKELIDPLFDNANPQIAYGDKKVGLISACLENLITLVAKDTNLASNFWMLWTYLAEKEKNANAPIFSEILLLDYRYWDSYAKDWEPLRGKKELIKSIILSHHEPKSVFRLLSGIGFTELMPDGISWLESLLNKNPFEDEYAAFYGERLAITIFYDKKMRGIIRSTKIYRDIYIKILDELINHNSASAFLIRDDFISLK